jgi:hypothetical protein
MRMLQQKSVRDETVSVLSYIAQNSQTEEIVAHLINDVFLREDIRTNLSELLIQGGLFCLEDEKTYDLFATFLTRVVGNQQLKDTVMENMLYSPIRSLFTRG